MIALEDWKNCTKEDILRDFGFNDKDNNINILLAYYSDEDYNGSAFVLFEQNGEFFIVEGGHCSCYGLEDQWEPVKTTVKTLKFMFENGTIGHYYGVDYYKTEMLKIIESLEKKNPKIKIERMEIV